MLTTLYKLTNGAGTTRRGMAWGEGVTHAADTGRPAQLCTRGVIRAYRSPLLAVLMDPVQSIYLPGGHLWEAEGEVAVDDGTKVGCRSLTTLRRVETPEVTTAQRVRFGILAAWVVCAEPAWRLWATRWLDGSDRSAEAAARAGEAARAAARAAAGAAARAGKAARAGGAPDLDLAAIAELAVADVTDQGEGEEA